MNLKMLCAAAAFIVPLASQAFAWDLLGSRDVADRVDRDTIAVQGGRAFTRIRLCISQRPAHFIDLDVRFANGGHQDVPVRAQIRAGQCTRAIDLTGDNRNIVSVGLVYEANTRRRGVGARVQLYGE